MKSYSEQFFDEHYRWKAEKEKHREKALELKRAASKEFYANNKRWFKTLDIIGIILIVFNCMALFMTGVLVVKQEPTHAFVEVNPVQCDWNGWSCHQDAKSLFWPFIKQMIVWAILITLYLYQRNHTFSYTGLWILTAILILYTVLISLDMINDLGLYAGKIIYAPIIEQ